MKVESPLEARMLIWYIGCIEPFPQLESSACQALVKKFEKNGIMRYDEDFKLIVVQDALDCFMNKIYDIELPKQVWV